MILGYRPIHRNVVTRRLKRLNQQKFTKLVEELKVVQHLSITTDFWSDRLNKSYLVITGHYYTSHHTLKSTILCFSSFNDRHKAENIANMIQGKLEELGIFHKVKQIVSDGAKNLSNAFNLLDKRSGHIWCFAHRLHLMVTSALALWPKQKKANAADSNEGKILMSIFVRN